MRPIIPILFLLLLPWLSGAQRRIAPNDPVYFQKSYILPKEQFYLLSVKRATAHYYQFYNDVAKQKRAKEITLVEIYPDSLITDTNLLINQLSIEKYHKGFLTEELKIRYRRAADKRIISFDTLDRKQYSYENRNRTVHVLNKLYGATDNYVDSLRTFYFNRRKQLLRTVTKNDALQQTDTRFIYKRSGDLDRVVSVLQHSSTQEPITEKRWEFTYSKQDKGVMLPPQLLDSARKIASLDFIQEQLSKPTGKAKMIIVDRFESLPEGTGFRHAGFDSVIFNRAGDYHFVLSADQGDTALQIKKIKGNQLVQRSYLELSPGDDRKRSFKYTTRQIIDGNIIYENNFRGRTISGSCSLDIEKTIITDTEDGTVEFYRIKR